MNIPALKLKGANEYHPERRQVQCARVAAIQALPKVYHWNGAFLAHDGRRFDLFFAELQRDPALPGYCFPSIGEIERALEVRFIRRTGRQRCSIWNWDCYP